MDINFNSLSELKQRIKPAINTKLKELKNKNYNIVTEDDIWKYLNEKWQKSHNLTLYDIINDILNLDNDIIEEYAIRRNKNEK